jgi:hypothetical protein
MEDKLKRLSEIAQLNIERRHKLINHENYSFEHSAYGQTLSNWTIAWNEYLTKKQTNKAKIVFNETGYIDLKRAELFNHRVLDMQNPRDNLCAVALSDNTQLINKYSEIDYRIKYISRDKEVDVSFREFANKGELVAIFSLSVLNAFRKDIDELNKSLEIFRKTISTKKSAAVLLPDFDFLDSLLSRDIDKIKLKIEVFLNRKLHKQRMRDELLLDDYISLPAILYLKIAWILGFEIEIKNSLIPMDLMPINPLAIYEETYLDLITKK